MASQFTIETNKKFLQEYDISKEEEYLDAFRGYFANLNGVKTQMKFEDIIKSRKSIAEINRECPDTVNPSFWKKSFIDKLEGVYEVIPNKLYQVRAESLDIANLTALKGQTGWIIIDCMSTIDSSNKAFELIKSTVEDLPVSAVVITHSHFDHFGGYDAVATHDTPLYIPETFYESLFDESIFAGSAMSRRAEYMYGTRLNESKTKSSGNGLNPNQKKSVSIPYSSHTIIIKKDSTYIIDGITFDFIPTPNTEAPANMMFYLPEFHALCCADNMPQTMHNLLTPRGAKVRSGKVWSQYIDNTIVKYGKDVQIHFACHNWPLYGNEKIVKYWKTNRDLYKYIHDQTLRYANLGYSPNEIAQLVKLPPSLANKFCCREFYGVLSFNIKSQYQLYLGWYDGNPAHLNELPPKEQARKYVQCFGGEEKAFLIGKEAFDNGDYNWAVTVLNHLVFCNPKNLRARNLLAQTYDQLSYVQESLAFKYSYSTGAMELRESFYQKPLNPAVDIDSLPLYSFVNLLSVSINSELLEGIEGEIKLITTHPEECITLIISNCVLHSRTIPSESKFFIKIERILLVKLFTKEIKLNKLIEGKNIETNCADLIMQIIDAVDLSRNRYSIIEPKN
ncbi:alkyl sulfatase, putative [Entamoeba histolytica HM-1:IMSS-B]|uniref:Alkyl sulfatase, putative n=6 Tax=Entamoeba histolytica TaxID=5759 RepID=C4LWU4_ENTH1|nr:alkyl sulfatase, putative [Entamoeba histolytica HM-1:IMSS]EMD48845.1 alkyl/arylsulfatase BDS1, putative [Entamoeba histolytica KU27]EMH77772.1 alkyl sulfatase, putative [Entamoeba histolytica HM-1:IMSS-B]EMS17360.1 alkyl/aryl-sulfatase BDS1, putative [Entamoeba histolytica HM-3:IMSS]ENY64678.1 alkyl/aryl-sulfatase BDS1, putative [Entamoeba histolytica HM-1:IMSS-A]GAT93187.1 alkyl sulfatase putative [Entamoeba histolytica]|eukprot:XP_653303.2 alkyl sulfatase, putative [Entamoeba histolytica HM-1:IMSS]